jgi:hypothetical protein
MVRGEGRCKGVPGIESVTRGRGGGVPECLKKFSSHFSKSIFKAPSNGATHPQALTILICKVASCNPKVLYILK